MFAARIWNDFISWPEVEEIAETHVINTVPLLFDGKFKSADEITEWFETHIKEPSSIGGEREGFVMRFKDTFPADEFSAKVSKYVRANHVQTDQHWTRNWQPCKLKR